MQRIGTDAVDDAERRRLHNVDRADVTPESVYRARRTFLKRALATVFGVTGLGRITMGARQEGKGEAAAGPDEQMDALRRSLRPPPGSAFTKCPHNSRYVVMGRMTDELVAARFNNFYEFSLDKKACWRLAQRLTVRPWTVEVTGLVAKPKTFDIDDLIRKMPCEERVYRFRCVERWAMIVPWSGFPFKALMDRVEPLSAAKYVRFVSFLRPQEAPEQQPPTSWNWPYYEGLRIDEAANELTFLATGLYGHDLPRQHGAPLRMVVPWKYGYKGAKSIVRIEFVKDRPRTFWSDAAPHEYGFFSNVDPARPHPRWSQEYETLIGIDERRKTEVYNGYAPLVAHLYTGKEF